MTENNYYSTTVAIWSRKRSGRPSYTSTATMSYTKSGLQAAEVTESCHCHLYSAELCPYKYLPTNFPVLTVCSSEQNAAGSI